MTTTTRTETKYMTREDGTIRSWEEEIITLAVTLNGETREIEFTRRHNHSSADSTRVFGCRKGQGAKIHRTTGTIRLDNGEWTFRQRSGYALNDANCLIVAFIDQVGDNQKSQHIGTAV
jgi:hypothetical protein